MDRAFPSPQIETPRLILRRLRPDDFESLFQMAAESQMWRFPQRGPMSSDEAWSLLLRHEGSWKISGYGVFAIEEKLRRDFVGLAGYSDFCRKLGPDFDPFPECTWSIVPSSQGRGYATEAGEAATRWLERQVSFERSVCMIHRDNQPSLAVARKLGYEAFRAIEYKGNPTILLQRRNGAL